MGQRLNRINQCLHGGTTYNDLSAYHSAGVARLVDVLLIDDPKSVRHEVPLLKRHDGRSPLLWVHTRG